MATDFVTNRSLRMSDEPDHVLVAIDRAGEYLYYRPPFSFTHRPDLSLSEQLQEARCVGLRPLYALRVKYRPPHLRIEP